MPARDTTPRRSGKGPHKAPLASENHYVVVQLSPEQWAELRETTEPLPGFHRGDALFSEAEWKKLRKQAVFQPDGTISEAIRVAMGLSPSPYGLTAAVRRADEEAERRKVK